MKATSIFLARNWGTRSHAHVLVSFRDAIAFVRREALDGGDFAPDRNGLTGGDSPSNHGFDVFAAVHDYVVVLGVRVTADTLPVRDSFFPRFATGSVLLSA